MNALELIQQAQAGEVGPVVMLVGAERFFVDRALAAVRAAVLGEDDTGFNEQVFQGKGAGGRQIVDAARTLPMLARRRLVLVRGIDAMAASDLETLGSYFDQPSDTTCLLMTAEKLDGRSRMAKQAKKLGFVFDAAPIKNHELPRFLAAEAKRRGLELRRDAGAALVEAVGNDLPALDDALERLSLYVGPGKPVDLAAVEACVSRVRVETIWALVDAVGQRDRRAAMKAAASLLADREPPLRILAMVARQLRMVGRMRDALADGMPPPEAAKAAGAPPFKARELAGAARGFDQASLRRAFGVLAETDLALKGSKRPPDTVLEGAILALTR